MSGLDLAELRRRAAEVADEVGPCNRRCRERGRCAFGRSDGLGNFCRERRPPRRGEVPAIGASPEPDGAP